MRRLTKVRLLALAGLMSLNCGAAEAQSPTPSPAQRANGGAVRIIAQGIAEPGGLDGRMIADLAERVDRPGRSRLLAVTGAGGYRNLSDLLFLRGIELAVVNSDVILTGREGFAANYWQSRLQYILPLYPLTVFAIGRRDIGSVRDLAGRTVLVPSAEAFDTASVIFAAYGIKVDVQQATTQRIVQRLLRSDTNEVAAALWLARVPEELPTALQGQASVRLLDLPLDHKLQSIYSAETVTSGALPQLVPDGGVTSLRMSRFIATPKWPTNSDRRKNITTFALSLLESLTSSEAERLPAYWQGYDPSIEVKGWTQMQEVTAWLARHKAGKLQGLAGAPTVARLRLMLFERPPLATKAAANQGFAVETLVSHLARGFPEPMRMWTGDAVDSLTGDLLTGKIDAGFPVERPDCAQPTELSLRSAMVCDLYFVSRPLFFVPQILFFRKDAAIRFRGADDIGGRVCLTDATDTIGLNAPGRAWIRSGRVKLVRAPSLSECFARLMSDGADLVLADELTGRQIVSQLGVAEQIDVWQQPVAVLGMSAVVSRQHPDARNVLNRIEVALSLAKADPGTTTALARALTPNTARSQ